MPTMVIHFLPHLVSSILTREMKRRSVTCHPSIAFQITRCVPLGSHPCSEISIPGNINKITISKKKKKKYYDVDDNNNNNNNRSGDEGDNHDPARSSHTTTVCTLCMHTTGRYWVMENGIVVFLFKVSVP